MISNEIEFDFCPFFCPFRITRMLIEQDGLEWREKLPEIPTVPLAVQREHREKPASVQQAQARAGRALQEEGLCVCACVF